MTEPTFGITFLHDDTEPRPAIESDLSVVGLIGPMADADMSIPFDDPIEFDSDDKMKLALLGEDNLIIDAINAINAQLADFQQAARIVLVRTEASTNVDADLAEQENIANILGYSTAKTGIHAFLVAGQKLGVIPRLIAAPGFTHQQPSGIASITVTDGGSGYTVAPTVTITPDNGATAHAILTGNAVTSVVIDNPGQWFDTPPTIDFVGDGTGATATATLEELSNPICSTLPGVLNKLLGMAVIGGPADSKQAFVDWRETLQSERLIPVASTVKITDANGVVQVRPSEGRVIGIGVRRDFEKNGKPFHSWANQPVQGIVGPNRFIEFSLTDGATEGQEILAANGGVILRGQYGVETATASGGFVYVGTDTLSEDSLWQFYNVVRGRDYIHLMFLRTLRYYLGRFNLNGQTIQSVVNTMEFALRDLKADNHILGYQVGFSKDQNSPEQLRLGKFTVRFAAEEPPVLRRLVIQSARYRPALDALLDDLLTQLEVA
jgi:hypothetical protein